MKNFISITEPQDIFNYLGNLWRSQILKDSHNDPNGYIHQISKRFSETPRIFFDMHQETMEMVHFSSWFHAIQHRYHYTNDVIHDLYYHHEFFHIITMTHRDDLSFEGWKEKMTNNEFWASLESEVLIYFYMPELRKQSFNRKIWVDKFLADPYYKGLFGKYFHLEDDLARKLKARIAYFRDNCQFNPTNAMEHEIAEYTTSSNEFARVWKEDDAWLNVETEMVRYLKQIKTNPQAAVDSHINWLKDLQAKDEYEVAFGKQARGYSEVHRRLFQSAYSPKN